MAFSVGRQLAIRKVFLCEEYVHEEFCNPFTIDRQLFLGQKDLAFFEHSQYHVDRGTHLIQVLVPPSEIYTRLLISLYFQVVVRKNLHKSKINNEIIYVDAS